MAQERRDYSQMSPQELNSQLRCLWEQFPPYFLNEFPVEIVQTSENPADVVSKMKRTWQAVSDRRSRSEHKKAVMDYLKELTGLSLLTAAGKQVALKLLEEEYDVGRANKVENSEDKERHGLTIIPVNPIIEILFDLDNPESGGIFDQESVRVIEQTLYRRVVYNRFRIRSLIEGLAKRGMVMFGGRKNSEEEALRYWEKQQQLLDERYGGNFGEMLANWRREFIEKYGDEP